MFSTTCEYAIRALIFIAQQYKSGVKVGIKDIAVGIDCPVYFTGKILQQLSKKGLVKSLKGPKGGFYMEEKNLDLTLATIVKQIDGERLFTNCVMGLKECSEIRPCPVHNEFKQIKERIKIMLESYSIRMFVENPEFSVTFLK